MNEVKTTFDLNTSAILLPISFSQGITNAYGKLRVLRTISNCLQAEIDKKDNKVLALRNNLGDI